MILTACGGNSLTLEQYFQNITAATEIAGQKVDALDAQAGSLGPNSTEAEVIRAFQQSLQTTEDILEEFGGVLEGKA